jgi:hypothetical protein
MWKVEVFASVEHALKFAEDNGLTIGEVITQP